MHDVYFYTQQMNSIPSNVSYDERLRVFIAAKTAGVGMDDAIKWWMRGTKGETRSQLISKWKGIKQDGPITPSTLGHIAKSYGHTAGIVRGGLSNTPKKSAENLPKEQELAAPHISSANREKARRLAEICAGTKGSHTDKHPYIKKKNLDKFLRETTQHLPDIMHKHDDDNEGLFWSLDMGIGSINAQTLKNIIGYCPRDPKSGNYLSGEIIVIPKYSFDEGKWYPSSAEFIGERGEKTSMAGQTGNPGIFIPRHSITELNSFGSGANTQKFVVAEGFATAVTACFASCLSGRHAMPAVSISISRLEAVACFLEYEALDFSTVSAVCADIDWRGAPCEQAVVAGEVTQSILICPPTELSKDKDDINDYACEYGLNAAAKLFEKKCFLQNSG